jgi:hypothetical protein
MVNGFDRIALHGENTGPILPEINGGAWTEAPPLSAS